MLTQIRTKKGIKIFGEIAVVSMFKDSKYTKKGNMLGKPVFGPIDYETLLKNNYEKH